MLLETRIANLIERIERVAWDMSKANQHLLELDLEARKLQRETLREWQERVTAEKELENLGREAGAA